MPSFSAARMLLVAMAIAASQCAFAQRPAAQHNHRAPPAAPAFDVVAIHEHIPEPHEHNSIWSSPFDSHFKAENMSLIMLIHWAFEMPETRIVGAPGWAKSTMFNIDAEAGSSVDAQLHDLSADAARQQKEKMVQALLADRFKLVTHTEAREQRVYALVIARGGAKLGDIKSGGTTINYGWNHLEVQGANSLQLLAEILSQAVGREVLDRTGITGRYDLTLKWTPDDATSAAPITANAAPSIFTALQEQLGLKLELQKGPVQVQVIDHAETPSGN